MKPISFDRRKKSKNKNETLEEFLTRLNTQDFEKNNSRWFPARNVMGTFPGKRSHLIAELDTESTEFIQKFSKLQRKVRASDVKTNIMPPIALCGAGRPSKSFPTGSGFLGSTSILLVGNLTVDDFALPVDCYKCLKVNYMNMMEQFEMEVPTRDFTPSNQLPSYSSYGQRKDINFMKTIRPQDILFVLEKGNIFVVFLKVDTDKGKKFRFHLKVPKKDVVQYRNDFLSYGIAVKDAPPTNPESYKRRDKHFMIPMGRYGVFGSNDTSAAEKLTEDILKNEEEIGIDNLDWLEPYFDPNKNPWRANTRVKQRRTQQEPPSLKPKNANFILDLEDLRDYEPIDIALENRDEDALFILEGMQEFLDILMKVPIETFYSMNPQFKMGKRIGNSVALMGIYNLVRAEREDEYKRYEASLNRNAILRKKQIFFNMLEEKLTQSYIEDGKGKVGKVKARRQARQDLRELELRYGDEFTSENFDAWLARAKEEDDFEALRRELGLEQRSMEVFKNPKIDRVLPLLERVEELDTLFLELEQEYAEIGSKRHR